MPPNVIIRDAVEADAAAGSEVMRRSITELCFADHQNDPAILHGWLRNKTPDVFRSWLAQPGNSLLVAVVDHAIAAVGSVTDKGEITLNYVSPEARFRGVSTAMLSALEQRAADRGCTTIILHSTATARSFYLSRGYVEGATPAARSGTLTGYPMSKVLKPNPD